MKRCFLSVIALLLSAALVFAQAEEKRNEGQFPPGPGFGPGPGQLRDNVTVQGTLSFVNGQIALKSGETTYYVWGLDRLFGFVEGLNEGAAVTLEGYAEEIPPVPEYRRFLVEKLILNGREYGDLRSGGLRSAGLFPEGSGPSVPHPPGGMMRNRLPPPPRRFFHDERREDEN